MMALQETDHKLLSGFVYFRFIFYGAAVTTSRILNMPQVVLFAVAMIIFFTKFENASIKGIVSAFFWITFIVCFLLKVHFWFAVLIGLAALLIAEFLKRISFAIFDTPGSSIKCRPILIKEFTKTAHEAFHGSRFFLGKSDSTKEPITIPDKNAYTHFQVVGTTGCGKTQFLMSLVYQALIRKWGLIYVTAKSVTNEQEDDFSLFKAIVKKANRLSSLNYFDPLSPEGQSFNPIRSTEPLIQMPIANQIARLTGREPPAQQEKLDAFHKTIDFERILVLSSMLTALKKNFVPEDIYVYFSEPKKRETLFMELEKKGDGDLVIQARSGLEGEILARSHTAGLTSTLMPWVSDPLGKVVNSYNPDIQIDRLIRTGGIAFFKLPVGSLSKQVTALGRMILGQILSCAESTDIGAHPPAMVILDEFSQYTTPIVVTLLSLVRAGRISLVLVSQDFGQLYNIEGMDVRAFISGVTNNAKTKIFFDTLSAEDADAMANTIGTETVTRNVESSSSGARGSSHGVSKSKVEEFIVHPNWFKESKRFLAVVKTEGIKSEKMRTVFFGDFPRFSWSPTRAVVGEENSSGRVPLNLKSYAGTDKKKQWQPSYREINKILEKEMDKTSALSGQQTDKG